jgi:hypothetical protein
LEPEPLEDPERRLDVHPHEIRDDDPRHYLGLRLRRGVQFLAGLDVDRGASPRLDFVRALGYRLDFSAEFMKLHLEQVVDESRHYGDQNPRGDTFHP